MKIRLDYVTNSSSSSFLIARKNELSEKQKEQLLEFAENLLGKKIAGTKEELDNYYIRNCDAELDENGEISKYSWYYNEYQKALDAINKGFVIYQGRVSFEEDYAIYRTYRHLFCAMDDNENYIAIKTDLSY